MAALYIALIIGLVLVGSIPLALFAFSLSPEWWLAQNEEIVRLSKGSAEPRFEAVGNRENQRTGTAQRSDFLTSALTTLNDRSSTLGITTKLTPFSAQLRRNEKFMSEEQLYEVARKRIDRRNRRYLLLGADFFAFMIYVGSLAAFYNAIPHPVGVFIAIAWLGVLVFHSIMLSVTANRDEAIESEVAKLRDLVYEKPKRLELNDDGELVEFPDETSAQTNQAARRSN